MSASSLMQFDNQLMDGLEFCKRVYDLFDEVQGSDNGPSRLRMRPTRLEKKLIEELLPLSRYIQFNYRIGRYISICWIDDNQTYDAEIMQTGFYVNDNFYPPKAFLEVTCAMHPNDYLNREMLEVHGYSYGVENVSRTPDGGVTSDQQLMSGTEFIPPFAEIIHQRISKKSELPYPKNTSLIIDCSLNYYYFDSEWQKLMSIVRDNLPETSFKEIFLFDEVGRYFETIYPKVG
jgi:hypothetical protein